MALPIDFSFDYEKPNSSRRSKMRTPVRLYLQDKNKTGGVLFISQKWLDSQHLNGSEIALQVKGMVDTYIIFNPPKNAPRFKARPISPSKGTMAYSCTESVRKILSVFNPNVNTHEMWVDKVGTFNDSIVYRLRNLTEDDTIYAY